MTTYTHCTPHHMTTANGIRSTADTMTAAPQPPERDRQIFRTRPRFAVLRHALTSTNNDSGTSGTQATIERQHPATRYNFHPGSVPPSPPRHDCRNVSTSGRHVPHVLQLSRHAVSVPTSTRQPRPRHDTPTFHAIHGHNVRGHHCRTHGTKKAPRGRFSGGAIIFYSVTSFTISSAVFPSRARTNFALASPRFTSGMCFSASWSILASPGVNLFNLSKTAKP